MITLAAYAAATWVLGGCAIYAAFAWGDERRGERLPRLRRAARRIRYGRGLRVPGLPEDGEPLSYEDATALGAIERGWKQTARGERSRT